MNISSAHFPPVDQAAGVLFDQFDLKTVDFAFKARQSRLNALRSVGIEVYVVTVSADGGAMAEFVTTTPPTMADIADAVRRIEAQDVNTITVRVSK